MIDKRHLYAYGAGFTSECTRSLYQFMAMSTILSPGCGFGFWYMWGVLRARKPTGCIWCKSGSALAMVVYLCDLDVETELQRCSDLRSSLTFCNVFRVVRTWLECALPDDCHTRCTGKMTILLRNVRRVYAVEYVSHWRNKTDLIDCLIAACTPVLPVVFRNQWFSDCILYYPNVETLPSRLVVTPPTPEEAREMYNDGLRDGRNPAVSTTGCEH